MLNMRRAAAGAMLVLGLLVPSRARAAMGSDLVAGYTWRDSNDGAVAETLGFDGVGTTIMPVDDVAPTGPVAIGFNFPFYGASYPNLWISDNGWIGFTGPYASAAPTGAANIPDAAAPNAFIATLWTQLRSNDPLLGTRITYGPGAGGQAFLIEVVAEQPATGVFTGWRTYLYRTGVIKMQYLLGGVPTADCTIGIENAAGNDGCEVAAGGDTAAGVPASMLPGYVIQFDPPPILPTHCAAIPSIACGSTTNASLPGGLPEFVDRYGCSATFFTARERVYSFTLATASVVDLTLTLGTGTNLGMFLLSACNEQRCLRGPVTSATVPLGAGTYYVVIDAPAQGNEGSFTLNLTCTPLGAPIACGATSSGTTAGGRTLFADTACQQGRDLSGPEAYYQVTVGATTNIRAQLSGLGADLDAVLIPLAHGEILAANCIAWGDDLAIGWNVPAGTYLVVVDGVSGASGAFTLNVQCRIDLACGATAGRVDFTGGRIQSLAGDTTGAANVVSTYRCNETTSYAGGERVYELVLPQPGQVIVFQRSGDPGLSFFILDSCNEGACLGADEGSGCGAPLGAGTHYLVVDSAAGNEGAFELLVAYEEIFNRWSECELPTGATLITDTVRNFWNLDDQAFCYDVPSSHNYPDGCVFAMYVVVQCGTAMHIPLFDVEGGHLRVFDVFNGQYVDLDARSPGWSMTGTEIQWQDADCVEGTDPRWNEVTTDVSFMNSNGLCGIFRIEFINHSGFVWELFANCDGARSGLFNIHDSLCGALTEYAPLPNLSLIAASAVASCPDVTITYEVRNDGCGLARDVPVRLYDNGVEVATDILPEAPYGVVTTRTFMARYPPGPTTSVTLVIDPDDVILECSEPAAGGASCDPIAGEESLPLPGCVGVCQVQADAIATPTSVCAGEQVVIDARGSGSSDCGGNVLEYQLRADGVIVVPYQASSVFPPQSPGAPVTYTIEVRCATSTTCMDSETISVPVERPPLFDAQSVTATDLSSCNLGIRLAWTAATFYGPTGSGVYNVYRSTVSCADAISNVANIVSPPGLSTTSFIDSTTAEAVDYYYVVEAEDLTAAVECPQVGPYVGGPSTRVDVQRGTCAAIQDSATPQPITLPRVGGSLRMGGWFPVVGRRYGHTFVDLQWTTDRPIDPIAGEHFHILRSEQPNPGTFTQLNAEPPQLTAQVTRDSAADDTVGNEGLHVWHYLVYVSDACENDNRGYDNP